MGIARSCRIFRLRGLPAALAAVDGATFMLFVSGSDVGERAANSSVAAMSDLPRVALWLHLPDGGVDSCERLFD